MDLTKGSLLSYVVPVSSNGTDYNIKSDVRVESTNKTFENGVVIRSSDNMQLASFNKPVNLNVFFVQDFTIDEQKAILDVINTFITTCKGTDLAV